MKTLTRKKTTEILCKQKGWEKLKYIWMFDRKLVLLPDEQIEEILSGIEAYKKQFKDQISAFDGEACDDHSLVANAFVKLKIAELKLPYTWAFADISATNSEKMGVHNQNLFIRENYEIQLYEPQDNKITLPKGEIPFYVRF